MNIESSELSKQLHCKRNIHMYDFHDDAGHHNGSQYKQSLPKKGKTQAKLGHSWSFLALLETLGHSLVFWTFWH